jgi:osomolarity two-component system sensor histidine kinase SLN1
VRVQAFNAFVLYTHYVREQSERRLFILRTRLDSQFKRMRQAQVNERAAADSKRRLTSCAASSPSSVSMLTRRRADMSSTRFACR